MPAPKDRRQGDSVPARGRRVSHFALLALALMSALLVSPLSARPRAQGTAIDRAARPGTADEPVIAPGDLPRLRPGQWDTRYIIDGREFLTSGSWRPGYEATCPEIRARRTPTGGFMLTGACSPLGSQVQVYQHAEGDFTTHFTVESRTSAFRNGRIETHSNATVGFYVGPCPAAP